MKILGIDTSSTRLGWCVWQDGRVLGHGMVVLRKDGEPLAQACHQARVTIQMVLLQNDHTDADAIAFEGAASRHASSLIAQSEVRGTLRGLAASCQILDLDITPQGVKKALKCAGNADKKAVIAAAAQYLAPGQEVTVVKLKGDYWATGRTGTQDQLYSEHEADALGVCLAASKIVKVVPA